MKFVKYTVCFLFVIFLISCGPVVCLTQIETLQPAKIPVDYSDKTLAIFSVLHVNHEDEDGNYIYSSDSLVSGILAEAAKETLENSMLFEDYDIPIYNLTLFCAGDSCFELHDSSYMQSLSEQSQAALLLIIDEAETNLKNKTATGSRNHTIHVNYKALYQLYDTERQQYIATIPLHDSVEFIFVSSTKEALNPDEMQNIWQEVLYEAGSECIGQILPQWVSEYRFYFLPFINNTQWYKSASYAEEGNWPEAMKIWGKLAGTSSGKEAAYAAFNMALGAEMLNEYLLSLEWLDIADKNARIKETDDYRKRIQLRLTEAKKINEQFK